MEQDSRNDYNGRENNLRARPNSRAYRGRNNRPRSYLQRLSVSQAANQVEPSSRIEGNNRLVSLELRSENRIDQNSTPQSEFNRPPRQNHVHAERHLDRSDKRRRPNPRGRFTRNQDDREGGNPDQGAHDQPIDRNRNDSYSGRSRGRSSRIRNRLESRLHRNLMVTNVETSSRLGERNNDLILEKPSNVQSEIAESQLRSNDFECMICCDNISRTSPIWYCPSCYNIFHLKCSIEWCNKSIRSRNEVAVSNPYPSISHTPQSRLLIESTDSRQADTDRATSLDENKNHVEWPCPACRVVLFQKPSKYLCFCGKVIRPDVNKHLTPHSCGQLCGRKRDNQNCPHTCNTICHPGKCMPCLLASKRSCFCGKVTTEIKCSGETQSCGQVCGKILACGAHTCTTICHSGPCKSCDMILTLKCYCGLEENEQLCTKTPKINGKLKLGFSCMRPCDKILDCGKHRCDKRCHPGPDCPSCKLLSKNIKSCPCGLSPVKKSLLDKREQCTDPVPTCESKCNKPLICGPEKNHHRCQKKCHTGSCPPCKLKSSVHCECRLSTKTVECSKMFEKVAEDDKIQFKQVLFSFRCEARCNKLKSCGRHRCYNKCCQYLKDLDSHLCDQICGKKLACDSHTCPEICHPGQCGDCTNIGWEELSCHCGSSVRYPPIPCGARPPPCNKPCRRSHLCGHPVKHECHDDTERCAPCIVFVKKSCFCGSESKDSVHCYLTGYSCGRTCKKLLSCGQHACTRVCHENDCEVNDGPNPLSCRRPCPRTRSTCKHPCALPCHGLAPCPTSDCKEPIKVYCECGNRSDRTECFKITRDEVNYNKMAMMSNSRTNQGTTFMIDLTKKLTPVRSETTSDSLTKRLDCDETCSILKRNKALAEALDITEPDLKPVSIFGEDPLKLLKEAVAQDYKFVSATFDSLSRFVRAARESDKRFIFMQFPPANKLRREIVHELAYHFNCTSESRDDEPFRHVVVRAYKNKSTVPDFNIEQLLPIED